MSLISGKRFNLTRDVCVMMTSLVIKRCLNSLFYGKLGPFLFVTPRLMGAYYLHPPDARAISVHNDSPCNDTSSLTGGTGEGGTNVCKN